MSCFINKVKLKINEPTKGTCINNDLIHSAVCEYNEKHQLIHKKIYSAIQNIEEWFEYDSKGNLVLFKDSYGYKEWYQYNDMGDMINKNNTYGYHYFFKYDTERNLIYYKSIYKFRNIFNAISLNEKAENESKKCIVNEYFL